MLRPRIIVCLLMNESGLVKTVNFREPKYVGDPINTVRIFNEKEVDELFIVNIDSSVKQIEPDYDLIEQIASECRMPLCYGGGIKNTEQIKRIISLGVEKVAISSEVVKNPAIAEEAGSSVGRQSVVAVLDVKKINERKYEVFTHNGTKPTGKCAIEVARKLTNSGIGELVINSICNDGSMKGYDLNLVDKFKDVVDVPLTFIGGAGSLNDISLLIDRCGIVGAAAGSLFVFKGIYRAVLINYPNKKDKNSLMNEYVGHQNILS